MNGEQPKSSTEKDEKNSTDREEELLRESLVGRKFSIEEAIGRLAGPGMMKGVSPITGKEQADAVIFEYLRLQLEDVQGALATVLYRDVKESEILLAGYERPLVALAGYVQQVLDSEFALKEFVREVDVEWGSVYGERPFFEIEGRTADAADPYTFASVRSKLTLLVEGLGQPNRQAPTRPSGV